MTAPGAMTCGSPRLSSMLKHFIALLIGACGTQVLLADDFNRPNVAATNDGSKLGWYWKSCGAGLWSLKDHELQANQAASSHQEADPILYHTRVALQSGNWSATVAVRGDTAGKRVGMVFMLGGGGLNFYQIRLGFGSKNLQVLRNGSAGSRTIGSREVVSSETFDPAKPYTITVSSTVACRFVWNVRNPAAGVVASGTFTDTSYTRGYAGIIHSAGDGSAGICHFDDFYVREVTVPPITRPHPRLLISAADVAGIKQAIARCEQPRYAAWLNLKAQADSLARNAQPAPYTGRDSLRFYKAAKYAGGQATKLALAYLVAGNPAHAAMARDILLAWARATPGPGTNFDPALRFANSGMDTARGASGLVYAYDFLYDVLTPVERNVVEDWLRAVLPTIRRGIDRWETPYGLSATDPRRYAESTKLDQAYFYGQLYQNHLVAHTLGCLLIGYALGDVALVQFAVDSRENPRDFLKLFDGMILMAGDSMVNGGDPMTPAPKDGEIIDRYRHVENHGLGYAMLSLSEMMAMSETLFANGLDFYPRVGAHGETLEKPFDFYADFFRLQDSSIKGGFYQGEGVGTQHLALFEVANRRYPGNPNIEALLKSVNRSAIDAGGSLDTYFCYPVLTHGVALRSAVVPAGSQSVIQGKR